MWHTSLLLVVVFLSANDSCFITMFLSLLFLIFPTEKINILIFRRPLLISISDQGCSYQDLPYCMFVSVWSCSCLLWSDIVKGADILLPRIFTGFSPSLMDEEDTCRRWFFCSSCRSLRNWLLAFGNVWLFPLPFKGWGWLDHMKHLKGIPAREKES